MDGISTLVLCSGQEGIEDTLLTGGEWMATLIFLILKIFKVVECYILPDLAILCILLALDTISLTILIHAWLAGRRYKKSK